MHIQQNNKMIEKKNFLILAIGMGIIGIIIGGISIWNLVKNEIFP